MTQAQQSEAQRLAAICETKGMFPVADELNRMHARILELEQGKCLHHIAEPAQTARPAFEAISQFMKCEWSLDWDKAGFYSDVKVDAAFTWFEKGYMRAQHAAANELERQHARILELEQGKCLHHIAEPAAIHLDDEAVDNLAYRMKAKLEKQREKGYGGWDTDCTQERLSELLRQHVDKGDPVDVANFCAFLQARGEGISAAPQAVQPAIMPKGESAAAQLRAMATNYPAGHSWDKLDARACIRGALEIEALRALLAAAPAHPAEGVPAPFSASGIAPCPLCGSESKHVKSGEGSGHRILCWNDDCECSSGYFSSKEDAIASWNSRAALAATQPAAQGMDAQDAARYRWLRNESWACYNIAKKKPEVALVAVVRDGACNIKMVLAEDAMDTAVDAALAAQAKQGGA